MRDTGRDLTGDDRRAEEHLMRLMGIPQEKAYSIYKVALSSLWMPISLGLVALHLANIYIVKLMSLHIRA